MNSKIEQIIVFGGDVLHYHKIIIVGESNLIRSFMAGVILQGLLSQKSSEKIEVISRGLVVLFSEPVAPKAAAVVTRHGYAVDDFRSSQLTQEDLDSGDLVLTMSPEILERLRSEFETQTACMSMETFLGLPTNVPGIREDSEEDYEKCFHAIEQLMEAVADRILVEVLPVD